MEVMPSGGADGPRRSLGEISGRAVCPHRAQSGGPSGSRPFSSCCPPESWPMLAGDCHRADGARGPRLEERRSCGVTPDALCEQSKAIPGHCTGSRMRSRKLSNVYRCELESPRAVSSSE